MSDDTALDKMEVDTCKNFIDCPFGSRSCDGCKVKDKDTDNENNN